jgi:hypothetical protein
VVMKGSVFLNIMACSLLESEATFWSKHGCLLHASFLFGLLLNPHDGYIFLQNVCWLLMEYMACPKSVYVFSLI